MSADRNLLFGILALQMDFITRDQLVAAMNVWVLNKDKPLGQIFVEQQALSPTKHDLLDPLVDEHIRDHSNDPQKSLDAIPSSGHMRGMLQGFSDADWKTSVGELDSNYGKTIPNAPPPIDSDGVRYRVLRPHARGGLGEVFIAMDTELNREVALKEIQTDKDRPDRRARFVFEAEVTGGLEHPGIVPVYGLGHYADGRPYYAMRYIRGDNLGEAITRFHSKNADYQDLVFRRLLQRFIDVCNAMAYAHSRGVLHRDLKPGNIMLGKYGETLVVDWGLAKHGASGELDITAYRVNDEAPLKPKALSDTAPTEMGRALGTPSYMSPEQAEGKLDKLGPASDVYSLGATLYHLLVGRPPNADCDATEILLRSQKGEVPPPRSIKPAIPPALDAICQKAMAYDSADRYVTAQSLVADIEHWLGDEPISALTEPFGLRAKRWARKHPASVAGIGVALLVSMIGLGAGLYFVDAERKQTLIQEQKTAIALGLADNRFDMALSAFNEMVFGMQNALETRAGTVELRRELLAKARPGLEKLLQEAESARGANHSLVIAYVRMGDVTLKLGNVAAAHDEFKKTHELARQIVDTNPQDAQSLDDLVTTLGRLGDVTIRLGNAPAAQEYNQKALDIARQLAEAAPKTVEIQRTLAYAYDRVGHVTYQMGNAQKALDVYRQGLELHQKLATAMPENADLQRDLSIAFEYLGDLTRRLGQADEARQYYRQCLEVREQARVADPQNAGAQRDVFVISAKLGDLSFLMNKTEETSEYYNKSMQIGKRLANADPKNAEAQRDFSAALERLGFFHLNSDAALAFDYYRQGMEVRQKLMDANPTDNRAIRDLSISFDQLGDASQKLGKMADALEYFRKGLDLCQRRVDADPQDAQAAMDRVTSRLKMAELHQSILDYSAAKQWWSMVKDDLQHLQSKGWIKEPKQMIGNAPFQQYWDEANRKLLLCENVERTVGDLDFALKQPADEIPNLLDARVRVLAKKKDGPGCIATAEAMSKLDLKDADGQYNSGCVWSLCADVAKDRKEECCNKAIEHLNKAVAAGFKSVEHLRTDKDLDAIRDRNEFQKVIADLQKKSPN